MFEDAEKLPALGGMWNEKHVESGIVSETLECGIPRGSETKILKFPSTGKSLSAGFSAFYPSIAFLTNLHHCQLSIDSTHNQQDK